MTSAPARGQPGRRGAVRSRSCRDVDPALISTLPWPMSGRHSRETTMEELVARIMQATGLDAETAQKATGIILAFLQKEGPAAEVGQLMAAIPGSAEALVQAGDGGPGATGGGMMGMLGGMMGGGGVMALGQKLMGAGVPMGQMQPLGQALFAFGRERAGEDVMGPIVGAIPGLNQFV